MDVIQGIDHVVILVRDLGEAARRFERLGFRLTPRGFHSIGTQNHCMMFGTDYLELLSVVTPHPVTAAFSDFLRTREGPAGLAFSSDDAAGASAALQAAGVRCDPPADFSRPVQLANGTRDAKFRVLQLHPQETPGCRAFICQHFTPELVWLPEFQRHPLGVTGILGLTMRCADPQALAEQYAKVLGRRAARAQDHWVVALRSAELRFVADAAGAADGEPTIAAVRLKVEDRGEARRYLESAGVGVREAAGGALVVSADDALGCEFAFE